uniref:HTH CENPB-type domain-containing protein n=1 Tax=Rhabditophanes sp. KR3021 TaxID=114890 RepID=A0AC35TGP8_9BILA
MCRPSEQTTKRKHPYHDLSEENNIPKVRKMKLYPVESKLDIIDLAKFIGNRAAGREFNVAESSIREWKKNEVKLRTALRHDLERNCGDYDQLMKSKLALENEIDVKLIEYVTSVHGISWYQVKEKALTIAQTIYAKVPLSLPRIDINLGWVARFMTRCENVIPKIPPPSNHGHSHTHTNNSSSNYSAPAPSPRLQQPPSNPIQPPTPVQNNLILMQLLQGTSFSQSLLSNNGIFRNTPIPLNPQLMNMIIHVQARNLIAAQQNAQQSKNQIELEAMGEKNVDGSPSPVNFGSPVEESGNSSSSASTTPNSPPPVDVGTKSSGSRRKTVTPKKATSMPFVGKATTQEDNSYDEGFNESESSLNSASKEDFEELLDEENNCLHQSLEKPSNVAEMTSEILDQLSEHYDTQNYQLSNH